ncbi:hypothetical protein PHLCEN_2v9218 [Hermanssonia centrifuga]|uniref:Uncharacterized protein n=1 Tax=Hermanssonia centrifuga TaxID=98765 RepID=A0A2R6NRD3_9APHY|nr:hypothetical protein PHLCEN_2v9218 [Hermanssonia centrifuga]
MFQMGVGGWIYRHEIHLYLPATCRYPTTPKSSSFFAQHRGSLSSAEDLA